MDDVYVVIEAEGSYSMRDWKVIGVLYNETQAILYAFRTIIEYTLKPWIIDFYKERDADFADSVSLPEIHIEHWCDNNKLKNIYIGFQERPFRHFIDDFLKKKQVESDDYENTILSWKNDLDNNIIPNDLLQFIKTKICTNNREI